VRPSPVVMAQHSGACGTGHSQASRLARNRLQRMLARCPASSLRDLVQATSQPSTSSPLSSALHINGDVRIEGDMRIEGDLLGPSANCSQANVRWHAWTPGDLASSGDESMSFTGTAPPMGAFTALASLAGVGREPLQAAVPSSEAMAVEMVTAVANASGYELAVSGFQLPPAALPASSPSHVSVVLAGLAAQSGRCSEHLTGDDGELVHMAELPLAAQDADEPPILGTGARGERRSFRLPTQARINITPVKSGDGECRIERPQPIRISGKRHVLHGHCAALTR